MRTRSKTARRSVAALAQNLRDDRKGAVAIQLGVIAVILIGFAALAVDIGNALAMQGRMQSAADAAALGSAAAVAAGYPNTYSNEAVAIAKSSFLNSPEQASFSVTPSKSVDANGTYVKVIITLPRTLTLVGVVQSVYGTSGSDAFNIGVTATALVKTSNDYCFLALNPTASGAVSVGGSATLKSSTVPKCGIADNSSSPSALTTTGSAANIDIPISVVGGWSFTGNPPQPSLSYAWPVTDPYANTVKVSLATPSCDTISIDVTGGKTQTLAPGTHCVSTSPSGFKGNGTINGSGVTLIFPSTFNFPNNMPTFNITPPTSGTYAGISIATLSSNPLTFLGGTSFQGSIYAPNSTVTMSGNSSTQCMQVIANQLIFSGNVTVNDSCIPASQHITGSAIQLVQ